MNEVISFSLSVALILILLTPINPAMAAILLSESPAILSPNLVGQARNLPSPKVKGTKIDIRDIFAKGSQDMRRGSYNKEVTNSKRFK